MDPTWGQGELASQADLMNTSESAQISSPQWRTVELVKKNLFTGPVTPVEESVISFTMGYMKLLFRSRCSKQN